MQNKEKKPFFNTNDPLFSYSLDTVLICLALLVMGTYLNGIAAVYHAVVCVVSAVISEYAGFKLVMKKNPLGDMSAFATGLLIALSLPACAPLWLGAMACVFAVLVAKLPFGGTRNAPFVPVAAGVGFVQLCFTDLMSVFSASSGGMHPVFSTSADFVKGTSLLDLLESGKAVSSNIFGYTDLLSGTYPGAIGTTCMLAMLGVVAYLLIRRPTRLLSSFGYIAACAVFALAFPRVNSGRLSSLIMELSAGSLVFVALLVVNDPVTSPKRPLASVVYGAIAGLLCMLLRFFGKLDEPAFFSVLLINGLWPVLSRKTATDRAVKSRKSRLKLAAKKDKQIARSAGRTEVQSDES